MKVSITLPQNVTEENTSIITSMATVGNLSPIQLQSADGLRDYLCAKSVDWKSAFPDVTFEPDETLKENETSEEYEARIVTDMLKAFADLNAGTIEAITMSKELFLQMIKRTEFKQPEQADV